MRPLSKGAWFKQWSYDTETSLLTHSSGLVFCVGEDLRPMNAAEWSRANSPLLPDHAVNPYFAQLRDEAQRFLDWRESKRTYDAEKRKAKPSWRPKNEI